MANSRVRIGKRRNHDLPLLVMLATDARRCKAFDLTSISNISASAIFARLSSREGRFETYSMSEEVSHQLGVRDIRVLRRYARYGRRAGRDWTCATRHGACSIGAAQPSSSTLLASRLSLIALATNRKRCGLVSLVKSYTVLVKKSAYGRHRFSMG